MHEQIELFYVGAEGAPRGAVVTTIGPDQVTCRVHFSTPDGQVGGGEAVIQVAGSVTSWTGVRFTSHGTTTVGRRVTADADCPVVPSYGLSALVLELVQGAERSLDLELLDESTSPPHTVRPARLVRDRTEDVLSPVQGLLHGCERVELTVAGRRTNTYWVRDGVVVASDWAGARSYALPAAAAQGVRAALGLAPAPA
ncbi:hypothetical protein [uncultured Cellulomonas sp.]|uniref:hypothetical protein n=1 Tax=uncultured Cellulomonas sp. TaxID=189682 RepID=UPI0028EC1882|nr:hypothetical protein [uncultured Cellulomonas sp.]